MLRALEVLELTGKPISTHWREGRTRGMPADLILRLETTPADERARIAARARTMWPALLREFQSLVPSQYTGVEPGFSSLGYPEARACLQGRLSSEDGLQRMINATTSYAKRQRTWFRHQLPSTPLDAALGADRLLAQALSAWEATFEKTSA